MKIFHVDTGREWRGGQAQVHHLIHHLPEDVTSHLLTPPDSALRQRLRRGTFPSSQLHSHPLRGEWDASAAWTIYRLHERHNFDLIHAHDSHGHGLAWLASVLFNTPPLVVTRRLEKPVAQNWFSQRKYNGVEHLIAISESVREALIHCGISREAITVIPSGVDREKVESTPMNPELIKRLGLNPDQPIVGNVGALCPQKNQKEFIEIASLVHDEFPETQFVIAGEGELRTDLETAIREKNLEGVFVMAGFQKDIIGLIKCFDLFVLTSVYEGLCSTLLQVMASKVPVIASEVGGVPEIVRDDVTGTLYPVNHPRHAARKVMAFMENPEPFQRMSKRASRLSERYDYQRLGERTAALYRKLVPRTSEVT